MVDVRSARHMIAEIAGIFAAQVLATFCEGTEVSVVVPHAARCAIVAPEIERESAVGHRSERTNLVDAERLAKSEEIVGGARAGW